MNKKKEKFNITRVITKDIITDSFQGLRNLFGLRLRGYEQLLKKNLKEMTSEMEIKYNVNWYRIIINPLTNGSAMVIFYGEGVKNE